MEGTADCRSPEGRRVARHAARRTSLAGAVCCRLGWAARCRHAVAVHEGDALIVVILRDDGLRELTDGRAVLLELEVRRAEVVVGGPSCATSSGTA